MATSTSTSTSTSTPHQLLLLADHLKLSLLERQRAQSLNLPSSSQKDAQITRSLTNFAESLAALETQDEPSSDLPRLRKQYHQLYAQFHGTAPPSDDATHPNDPALAPDFAAAQRKPSNKSTTGKNVRFRDDPSAEEEDANRAALFSSTSSSQQQQPYTDEPMSAQQEEQGLDNQQIHAYHSRVLREQDEQLDVLGQSVGRQRLLGIQMGDELDEQNEMLGDVERGVDRHSGTLDAAQRRLGKIARKGRDGWNSWITIAILVVVLVLLIAVLK
ncbi:related to syntaxin 8 [Ramularia collo-cygni]|uniref:Related to syntaxin 8 n=1 Tax=Ramularia collo-cygni TaxID=112498 RepID=A0A2D3VI12_9PEZI|nr:related to syntaxin 8 [Ramularia collo-cygni]CZT25002.1 related to syntaxin 8 [Ramularia collo-cygni]